MVKTLAMAANGFSFGNALETALICMAIVFSVLIALWILVSAFSLVFRHVIKSDGSIQNRQREGK